MEVGAVSAAAPAFPELPELPDLGRPDEGYAPRLPSVPGVGGDGGGSLGAGDDGSGSTGDGGGAKGPDGGGARGPDGGGAAGAGAKGPGGGRAGTMHGNRGGNRQPSETLSGVSAAAIDEMAARIIRSGDTSNPFLREVFSNRPYLEDALRLNPFDEQALRELHHELATRLAEHMAQERRREAAERSTSQQAAAKESKPQHVGLFFGGTSEGMFGPAIKNLAESQEGMGQLYYPTPAIEWDQVGPIYFMVVTLGISGHFTDADHDVETDDAVEKAVEAAIRAKADGFEIILIGWSRGAILALAVAKKLNDLGIDVDYLGLIDPVATGYKNYPTEVPPNVRRAFRSLKNEDANEKSGQIWKNAEIGYARPERVKEFEFDGTHAGGSADTIEEMVDDARSRGIPLEHRRPPPPPPPPTAPKLYGITEGPVGTKR